MSDNNEPTLEPGVEGEPLDQSTVNVDEPDYKSLYEEGKASQAAELARVQADATQARAVAEARMSHLEGLVTQIATTRAPESVQAEPIDPDDPKAMLMYTDRVVKARIQENDAKHDARFNQLAGQAVEVERATVDKENPDVIEKFQGSIDEYYARNPHERNRPGAYRDLVTYLKGQHFEELAQDYKPASRITTSGVPTPTPVAPSGSPPKPAEPEVRTLDAEQARLAKIYGQLEGDGEPISAEEWFSVAEDRDKYPGRRPARTR